MAIEIERKFLVLGDAWRHQAEAVVAMTQGYLNELSMLEGSKSRSSVRVRIEGDQAFLNIKSHELGHTRHEFDYPIPVEDARQLLSLCMGSLVTKHRHYVRHQGHLWEIDEFLDDNTGLVVAEIELRKADEAFVQPEWLGKEVTDEPCYYNLALASLPYRDWNPG